MTLKANPLPSGIKGVCCIGLLALFAVIHGASLKSGPGAGGGSKTTMTNVTSTVFDVDTSGALLLFRSDDFNGTNEATYTAVNSIASFIDSNGVWFLDLYPQKTGLRTVFITPNVPVGSEPAAPPPNDYWKNVEITSKCTDSSGNNVPFSSLVNGSNSCTLGVDFGFNGITYKLLVGRVLNASDPKPGTASIACNTINSNNQCVAWTITVGNSAAPTVANLYSFTGRPSAPWIFIGQYYNSARVQITNP
ncbi:MAG TPA: hypothetical protein VFU57_06580 [Candidatus Acidoferrales bacterium]|nr:hypothetical protein [Candidatus Acidoferrales bacterium]